MASTIDNDPNDVRKRLSELRQSFIELKATLDHNIKENHATMRKIAALNYDIDRRLAKPTRQEGMADRARRRHGHPRN
jgi:hypothetical protein